MTTITKRAPELAREPVKEPAKRWRNVWFVFPGCAIVVPNGRFVGPCWIADTDSWPSREVAVEHAIREARDTWGYMEYVRTEPAP